MADTYSWIFLSFAVFAAALWIFGRPIVLKTLDQKIATIRQEVQNAAQLRAEAKALLEEYEQRQRDAQREIDTLIAQSQTQAEQAREAEEARLNDMMTRKEQQLTERINLLRDQTIQELSNFAAQLAYQATEKIVSQRMDDTTREALISRALNQVQDRLQA